MAAQLVRGQSRSRVRPVRLVVHLAVKFRRQHDFLAARAALRKPAADDFLVRPAFSPQP
jgi:hypothetical protein